MIPLHKKEQDLIDEIIDNFDFKYVEKTMTYLNWGWGFENKIPTIEELMSSARQRIINAIEGIKTEKKWHHSHSYMCSSGGLKATVWKNRYNQICHIQLEFILTDWGTY